MLAKWVVFSVRGYLSDSWNLLDGSIVLISLLSLLDSIESLNFLRALRVLRALRPLRLLHRFPGMQVVVISLMKAASYISPYLPISPYISHQVVVISLMKAGPAIINVMVVMLLFWTIFGILGVQVFKGTFYQCSPSETLANLTEVECLAAGGGWLRHSPGFDNIFEAIVTLFEVRTLENWARVRANPNLSPNPNPKPTPNINPSPSPTPTPRILPLPR